MLILWWISKSLSTLLVLDTNHLRVLRHSQLASGEGTTKRSKLYKQLAVLLRSVNTSAERNQYRRPKKRPFQTRYWIVLKYNVFTVSRKTTSQVKIIFSRAVCDQYNIVYDTWPQSNAHLAIHLMKAFLMSVLIITN